MAPIFKTSQRVTILDEGRRPLVKGAIVRSFNPNTGQYHLTLRTEEDGIKVFYAHQEQLVRDN